MTNKEVLERGVPHEGEELMYFLLSDFWDKLKEHGNLDAYSKCPINLVSAYKDFLNQETIVDTNIHDKYHNAEIVTEDAEIVTDAEWREL